MEYFLDYILFLAKVATVFFAFFILLGGLAGVGSRVKESLMRGHIEIEKLNDHYDQLTKAIAKCTDAQSPPVDDNDVSGSRLRRVLRFFKNRFTEKKNIHTPDRPRIFVVDFNGDIRASAVSGLEKIISAVIAAKKSSDHVVLRLESSGGLVHAYGLAASQLKRLKLHDIGLTVCVDKVAASGGYMMACVADKIICAPFSVIGSIGVLAQLPNFYRLLQKNSIDYEMITAGEYKRTLTLFGENTEKGRIKFSQDIQSTHDLFKAFVKSSRPTVNIDEIATGEIWYGSDAIGKNMVDQLQTSEDYIFGLSKSCDIYCLKYVEKKSFQERISSIFSYGASKIFDWMTYRDRESQHLH